MNKLSLQQFKEMYPDYPDYYEKEGAVYFYTSEYPQCPYIGVEFKGGVVWVYGANSDIIVDGDELEWYLSQPE